MSKFLVVIVLFLAITLVIFSFSELQRVVLTLQQANLWFVLLAVMVEALWAFVLGSIFHSIYPLLGIDESRRRLTLLGLASTFLGVVTTSAVGGLAMFLADGRRQGTSHRQGDSGRRARTCSWTTLPSSASWPWGSSS